MQATAHDEDEKSTINQAATRITDETHIAQRPKNHPRRFTDWSQEDQLQAFLAILWDIGLVKKVVHLFMSVRTHFSLKRNIYCRPLISITAMADGQL